MAEQNHDEDGPCEIGRPATADQQARFEQIIAERMADMKRREEEAKEFPHKNFIERATAVGFTEIQAEFLWNNRCTRYHESFVMGNAD
jgi:hypothetical protein